MHAHLRRDLFLRVTETIYSPQPFFPIKARTIKYCSQFRPVGITLLFGDFINVSLPVRIPLKVATIPLECVPAFRSK